MIDLASDLGVFFDPGVFAVECRRERDGTDEVLFAGITGVVDEEMLDGHVVSGARRLRYATEEVDLLGGDLVHVGAAAYRVAAQGLRVVDGAESEAILIPAG